MRIISFFVAFIYTVLFLVLGLLLVGMSLEFISMVYLVDFLNDVYSSPLNLLYAGLIGLLFFVLALAYIYSVCKRGKAQRNISFTNPDGEVNISLKAIEDFVKRIAEDVTEIKELDCKVINSKRSVKVINNVVLRAGTTVPEIAEKFQNMIKVKLQGILGIEDKIQVKVYIKEVEEDSTAKSVYSGELDYSK